MKIPILAYHELYEKKEEEIYCSSKMASSCIIRSDNFKKQLEIILSKKIQTVTFKDLEVNIDDLEDANNLLVLTFDDGHVGNYLHAFPLLKTMKMPAVFFVTTSLIDTNKMMTWSQLREMSNSGMSIESHAVSHEPFETLSLTQVEEELRVSKVIIEDKIGKAVTAISLPHGSMHSKSLEIAERVGYRFICTSMPDYFQYKKKTIVMPVPRISIFDNVPCSVFEDLITCNCNDVYIWKRKQKIKYTIKRIIGINNYRKIYRLVNGIRTV